MGIRNPKTLKEKDAVKYFRGKEKYNCAQAIDDKDKSDHIEQSFNLAAGATACREILKLKILSCAGCVKTASQLLSKHINKTKYSFVRNC